MSGSTVLGEILSGTRLSVKTSRGVCVWGGGKNLWGSAFCQSIFCFPRNIDGEGFVPRIENSFALGERKLDFLPMWGRICGEG